MENKKQEAIRLAYEKLGFEWEQIKNIVTENGVLILSTPDLKYSLKGYDKLVKDKDKFSAFGNDGLKLQPSSLIGIWNNNGWISIESEEDLPKEYSSYHAGKMYDNGKFRQLSFSLTQEQVEQYFKGKSITHYQPIQKQKPPIF